MSQRVHEWVVLIAVGSYSWFVFYDLGQPYYPLTSRDPSIIPLLSMLLGVTVVPALAIHLGARGGWKGRGVIFWLAQGVCWAFSVGAVVLGVTAGFGLGLLPY